MDFKDEIKLQDELEREKYWEEMIEEAQPLDYLTGLKTGLEKRKDMSRKEKTYYISLINQKLRK